MRVFLTTLFLLLPGLATAQCGGSFSSFVQGLKSEARAKGYDAATTDKFFASARQDQAVLRADRSQGVFQKPFVEFSRRLISNDRINRGRANGQKFGNVFNRVEREYGVDRNVLLAFWAKTGAQASVNRARKRVIDCLMSFPSNDFG